LEEYVPEFFCKSKNENSKGKRESLGGRREIFLNIN
jgi:hypothetical protein